MNLHLTGKVAVITGGSEGIGKAAAMAFSKEGCKVAVCSRSQKKLEAVAVEFRETGYDLYTQSVDVGVSQQLYAFVDEVYGHFGRIDIWVNNTAQTIVKSIFELSLPEWDKIMKTNLDSYFIATQAAGKYMKQNGGGVIVNVSSYGGILPPMYRSAYCTSKHAINWLTRCSAAELAPFGIRVNAVAPGTINTAMQAAAGRSQEDVAEVAKNFALHRPGEPEEAANVILFLASDMSSYCDGIIIECSGGKFLAQDCDTAWTEMR
jgi:NAD(P)-dependent dehydrogenase (short-subunit alcohol dehydrogenase family)